MYIVQVQAVTRVGVGEYSDPLGIVGKNTTCDTARVGDGEYPDPLGKNSSALQKRGGCFDQCVWLTQLL